MGEIQARRDRDWRQPVCRIDLISLSAPLASHGEGPLPVHGGWMEPLIIRTASTCMHWPCVRAQSRVAISFLSLAGRGRPLRRLK